MRRRLHFSCARLRALRGFFLSALAGLSLGMGLWGSALADDMARDPGLQISPRLTATLPPPSGPRIELAAPRGPSPEVTDDLPRIATLDLTAPPADLWQRIRNGFAMPNLDSPLVADRQAWYLNRPDMIKRMSERSRRYLFYIVEELEKRGMPTELALLPMVESAFNPLAYSSARALGIWQFIPSTGKTYRLEQNWWMDQRRDIIASTGAALDYLQFIYEMQGDWHLALASYNWGENAVARAVAKNKAKGLPTDYVHLTMPGETRYYVPKLQALKNIIANPETYGIKLDPIPNKPYFGTVDKPAAMDVSTAARLAEIPVDEFIALNPAYSRPLIPESAPAPLVLPADKVPVFLANVERHEIEDKPLSLWRTDTLKKGEKLDAFAARHGLSTARLKQINSIGPRSKIGPGSTLLVPTDAARLGADSLMAKLPQTPAEPAKATGKGRHRGKGGKSAGNSHRTGKGSATASTRSSAKSSKSSAGKSAKGKKR